MEKKNEQNFKLLSRKNKRILFYAAVLALPILQYLVFYVYVNLNTILLAFQSYKNSSSGVGYDVSFAWFDNFASVINRLGTDGNISMIWNSLLVYAVTLSVGTTLSLFFSYYIYKKYFLSKVFQVFLFLPQVLSGVVLALLFKYMVTDAYIALTGSKMGLLDMADTRMGTLLFFQVWASFGANILIYSGSMSGINESVVESAQLEGVNPLQEFWYIIFPMIFPTFITFFVSGIAGVFSNQLHLYTIYENNAPISTVGYYLYTQSVHSGLIPQVNTATNTTYLSYSEIAAFGIMITIVVVPITLFVRKVMNKYGPNPN